VYAEFGLPDQLADLVEPVLSGIRPLGGNSGTITQVYDSKKEGTEKGQVLVVKRAVDEDVQFIAIDRASKLGAVHLSSFGGLGSLP
jgi:hypothetical protein